MKLVFLATLLFLLMLLPGQVGGQSTDLSNATILREMELHSLLLVAEIQPIATPLDQFLVI
jgi:hypothetical protein